MTAKYASISQKELAKIMFSDMKIARDAGSNPAPCNSYIGG